MRYHIRAFASSLLFLAVIAVGSTAVAQKFTAEAMGQDLDFLLENLRETHPDLYRVNAEKTWEAKVARLRGSFDDLDVVGYFIGLREIVALAADGHTSLSPAGKSRSAIYGRAYPVRMMYFAGSVYITATSPELAKSAGGKVVAIGGRPMDAILNQLVPMISADNSEMARVFAPRSLLYESLHNHLGLCDRGQPSSLTLEDAAGKRSKLELEVGPAPTKWSDVRLDSGVEQPLWLRRLRENYWFEYLQKEKTVFMQFNIVRDSSRESFAKFCERLFTFIDGNDVDRLIIDLRHNGGGNNYKNQPLVHGLIRCRKIDKPGKLFVITSPRTFSAAVACCGEIDRQTNALFVGEPTGAGPNHAGDAIGITLPNTKFQVRISKLWWQWSDPRDMRSAIMPDIKAPVTFKDWMTGNDPALEAILAYDSADAAEFGKWPPNMHWRRASQKR